MAERPKVRFGTGGAGSTHERSPDLYAGVMLLFAPIGLLLGLIQHDPAGWAFALVLAVTSGGLALGWAVSLDRKGWWLALIPVMIVLPMLVFPRLFASMHDGGLLDGGYSWDPFWRRVLLAASATVSLSLGWILTVRAFTTRERIHERARAELDVARRVHESIAPPIAMRTPLAEVLARSDACNIMGGDLIDARAGEGVLDVCLADVSGHGVGAGIVMAMVKSALRTRQPAGGEPEDVLADLNKVLCDLCEPGMFTTAACVRLRRGPAGTVLARVAIAGHPPAAILRTRGEPELVFGESLPLGILREETFVGRTVQLDPGDVLALYTDGLTEAPALDGRQVGVEGLVRILRSALDGSDASADPEGEGAGAGNHDAAGARTGEGAGTLRAQGAGASGGAGPGDRRATLDEMQGRVLAQVRSSGPAADDQSLLLVRVLES